MTTGNISCTTLTVSGAATTAALTCSGLITANAGLTVASGQTLTLTGATVAGAPTWSSSQAITLSTAAQPNITSVGTLTSVTSSGFLQVTGSSAPASGAGAEINYVANRGYFRAYDRTGAAYKPLTIDGSTVDLAIGGTNKLSIDASGNTTLAGSLSTGSNSITGGAISGTTGAFSNSADSGQILSMTNANAGTSAQAIVRSSNGTNTISMGMLGTGFTTAGLFEQGAGYLYSQQNINILSGSGVVKIASGGTTTATAIVSSTGVTLTGDISTTDPAGGAGPAWKLGVAAAVSPTSPNRTVRIDIGGTSYYLAAKTTND